MSDAGLQSHDREQCRPRPRWPFWIAVIAIACGLAFRARVIAMPIDVLTARYLADDYFYYLGAARHAALGLGSSVDGVTLTNGYQPLFFLILAGLFLAGVGKVAAIHLGLVVHALSIAAAAFVVYFWSAARGRAAGGALVAGLLSLNLFFVLPSLTGFELPLAVAGLVCAWWCRDTGRRQVVIGAVCGLALLARVDNAIVAALFGCRLIGRRKWRDLATFAGGLLVIVIPWIAWSLVRFATITPDSGAIKAHYRGLQGLAASAPILWRTAPRLFVPGRLVDRLSAGQGETFLIASAACILLLAGWQAMHKGHRGPAVVVLGIAAAYFLMIDPHEPGALVRYLFPVWVLVVWLVAQHDVLQRLPVVLLVLAVHAADAVMYVNWERTAPVPQSYVGASAMLMPQAIERLVPPGAPVGAFDSGSLNYFAPRPVVNLDGLANHEIVELRRHCEGAYRHCLVDYMRAKNIRIFAGGTGFGWTAMFPDWRQWERLYESPPLNDGSTIVLLRVPAG